MSEAARALCEQVGSGAHRLTERLPGGTCDSCQRIQTTLDAFAADKDREIAALRAELAGVHGTVLARHREAQDAAIERAETAEAQVERLRAAFTAWQIAPSTLRVRDGHYCTEKDERLADLRALLAAPVPSSGEPR